VLGYVCRIGKSRHNLIPRELIIFLDLFDFIACGQSPEHGCDIDSCTVMHGFPKRIAGSIVMPG
jgi:hypothetical protein